MFGYIVPFKAEMKVKEFETYKSVYCGLCHQLGNSYGFSARMFLSYDFSFMILFLRGLHGAQASFSTRRCVKGAINKKVVADEDQYSEFCAKCVILLSHYKVKDSIQDEGFWRRLLAYLALPFTSRPSRKIKKSDPQLYRFVTAQLKKQANVEKQKSVLVDEAGQATGSIVSFLSAYFVEDDDQRRIVERFGYQLGRLIYLLDALDDYDDDKEKNKFNPFVLDSSYAGMTRDEIIASMSGVINMTIGEISASYNLLDFGGYQSILDNFIYLGLKNKADQILSKEVQ